MPRSDDRDVHLNDPVESREEEERGNVDDADDNDQFPQLCVDGADEEVCSMQHMSVCAVSDVVLISGKAHESQAMPTCRRDLVIVLESTSSWTSEHDFAMLM